MGFNFLDSGPTVGQVLVINGEAQPIDPRFSDTPPTNLDDFERIAFALDGFPSALDNEVMAYFGIDRPSIANLTPWQTVSKVRVGLIFRLHPIPFALNRTDYVLLDVSDLVAKHSADCIPKLLQNYAARAYDHEFRKSCELAVEWAQ